MNKHILRTSGVRLDTGLTTSSIKSSIKRQMVQCAINIIAVLDHSKFSKIKTTLLARFNEIDVIVTSSKVPKHFIKSIEKEGFI